MLPATESRPLLVNRVAHVPAVVAQEMQLLFAGLSGGDTRQQRQSVPHPKDNQARRLHYVQNDFARNSFYRAHRNIGLVLYSSRGDPGGDYTSEPKR